MSDSDSMGGSGSDLSGELPPTSARRASGRRRRFQVIGALAVVAVAATVIVGITTAGSRSGTYTGATLTCSTSGQTVFALPAGALEGTFAAVWKTQSNEYFTNFSTGTTWSAATPQWESARFVTVTEKGSASATDTWSIGATCS